MLVVERKVGQSVIIDNRIVVKYIELRENGRIRIGFDAPMDVPIFREEIAPVRPRRRE